MTNQFIQEDLPNFHAAMATAQQEGLDSVQHLTKQYIRYQKMLQKCTNPTTIQLMQRQKARLANQIG